MTLIVCLTGADCVVMAADSLTTQGTNVVSRTARKIHRLSDNSIVAGSGLAKVYGRNWQQVFDELDDVVAAEGGFGSSDEVEGRLHAFLNRTLRKPTSIVRGECRGGNTLLLAKVDTDGQPFVSRLSRHNDDRWFSESVPVSISDDGGCIEFAGDVAQLIDFEDKWRGRYRSGMLRAEAEGFCTELLRDGIAAAASLSSSSIGGDIVTVVTIDHDGIHRIEIPV